MAQRKKAIQPQTRAVLRGNLALSVVSGFEIDIAVSIEFSCSELSGSERGCPLGFTEMEPYEIVIFIGVLSFVLMIVLLSK